MKVALFVHCFFPEHFYGTETYTLQVARYLLELGHQPVVVSAVFQGEPPRESPLTRYEYEGVPVYCIDKNALPHARVLETYYQESMRPMLRSVLREIAPNVVHVTHLINHTAVLLEEAAALGIPTVATFTDFFGFCFNNKLEDASGALCAGPSRSRSNCVACYLKAIAADTEHPLLRRCSDPSYAVAISAGLTYGRGLPGVRGRPLATVAEDLARRPGVLAQTYRKYRAAVTPTRFLRQAYERAGFTMRMFDVRFGVELDRAPKAPRPPASPVRFGFIGQVAPHKGVDLLATAFMDLPEGGATLAIHGPLDQTPAYAAQVQRSVAGRAVSFEGTFDANRMRAVLDTMDVLVIPSRWYENSPLVLLYALASHTPVIVADVAGLTEFIEEGRNGFSFLRGSADDLARAMRRFVKEASLCSEMSAATAYPRTPRDAVADLIPVYNFVLEKQ